MISIIYTNDTIESEPGPNFYWRGNPLDFLQLVFDFHALGKDNDIEINLTQFNYIQVKGEYSVKAKSSINGTTLCNTRGNTVTINLSNEIWRQILIMFLSISYYPSHNYIEFDNNLIESANFIISSEGQLT